MDMLASGMMSGRHRGIGGPSRSSVLKESQQVILFLWKVPSRTMGDRFLGLQLWAVWMGTGPQFVWPGLASVTAPWPEITTEASQEKSMNQVNSRDWVQGPQLPD